MANREACELYIEQEIKSGLEEGKTPYSIGKELSTWVAKLFEVRISPHTLRSRADRIKHKTYSNESKKSQTTETIEDTTPDIIKGRKPQGGGKREGAGRPKSWNNYYNDFNSRMIEVNSLIKDMIELPEWATYKGRIQEDVHRLKLLIGG